MIALAAGLAAASGPTGCRDERPPASSAARPAAAGEPTGPAAAPVPAVLPLEPSYPDTVQGLESLMTALVAALRADDAAEQSRILLSLRLPEAGPWFLDVFGPELGPRLLAEYEPQRAGIGWLASAIRSRIETGLTSILAERFDSADQPAAVGYQSAALGIMKRRVPLYSVRFASPDSKKAWHVWSFVHERGTFRYLGKMRRVANRPPPAEGRDPLEYRRSDAARVGASPSIR